jgi:AbrB family looped-hinge helix DNA binding protein
MRTTIDAAGRLVVPKGLRDELGFGAGQELEVVAVDGRLEVTAPPTPMRLEDQGGVLVGVPERDEPLPPLTDDVVRDTVERVRR